MSNYRKCYKTYKVFCYYGLVYNLYNGKRIDNFHSNVSFCDIFIGYMTFYSDGEHKPEMIRIMKANEPDRVADILHK